MRLRPYTGRRGFTRRCQKHGWRWQSELQLITQALIWSERGEHVTVPVVNKSSQLLLLIITAITLIISNSAPRYAAVSARTHLWTPRSALLMSPLRLTLVCLIMSYAPGFAAAAGREWANSVEGKNGRKDWGICCRSHSPWLSRLAALLFPPPQVFFSLFVSPVTSHCSWIA